MTVGDTSRADGETPVVFGEGPASLDDVCRIADGAPLRLDTVALDRIRASRAVVERALEAGRPVYGLNTGLGHLFDQVVEPDLLRLYQVATVALHDGGVGQPLPARVVRAAMAARLNGICRGGSGASPAVALQLAAMLDAGVHPVVPRVGSVGASDLMHMAAIASVVIGRGRAEVAGETLDGAAALARVGLAPLVLEPKDALALISANGMSIGHGALVVEYARQLLDAADIVAATSMEVTRANPSIIDPAVAAAKPMPGQAVASNHLRALLADSGLWAADGPARLQDPLSFRVVPQVHGAARDVLGFVRDALTVELNAMDDNPLVDAPGGRIIHNGNFHPMTLAIGFDALRVALAHVGQISDRRMNHLWRVVTASDDLFGAEALRTLPGSMGRLLQRYAATALFAELRELAAPVTLDIGSLDQDTEDHATNAPLSVQRTAASSDTLAAILGIELSADTDISAYLGRPASLAPAVAAVLDRIAALVASLGPGASSAEVSAAVAADLTEGVRAAASAAVARGSAPAT